MVAYAWTCHACSTANPAGSDACAACGCAANASRTSLERDLAQFQARNPAAQLEAQLPPLAVLGNLLAWLLSAVGLLVWWVASDSAVSYGGLGLIVLAWLLRKSIARFHAH